MSNSGLSKDTPYLALTGEIRGVYCKSFAENWLRFNGTALYSKSCFGALEFLVYWNSLHWRHNEHDGVSNHQPLDWIRLTTTHVLQDILAVYSGTDQRKHQSSASLAFLRGIHRWPVKFPHKWPVTPKMFPFDDVIMWGRRLVSCFVACNQPSMS